MFGILCDVGLYIEYSEDAYEKELLIDNENISLKVLDTSGQEEFDTLQDQWIRKGDGFLLVYSITSINSFKKCVTLRDKILRFKDDDIKYPIILVGNKCDLDNERKVSISEGKQLANQWESSFFETSAKENINVNEIFHECLRYHIS